MHDLQRIVPLPL